jgi:uncharacterized membrane protein YeaQ/YmgE (transglycosylase-associated protein family)
MNILLWIVLGLLAGWIASLIVNRHHGLLVNLAIGLIGALIGGWLAGLAGFYPIGFWSSLLTAVVGAVVLLFLLSLFRRRA